MFVDVLNSQTGMNTSVSKPTIYLFNIYGAKDYMHLYRLETLRQFQQLMSTLRNSSTTGNVKASTARVT